jgi:hypothetical protein
LAQGCVGPERNRRILFKHGVYEPKKCLSEAPSSTKAI